MQICINISACGQHVNAADNKSEQNPRCVRAKSRRGTWAARAGARANWRFRPLERSFRRRPAGGECPAQGSCDDQMAASQTVVSPLSTLLLHLLRSRVGGADRGSKSEAQIGVLGLWNARFAAALRAASAPHRVHVTTKWRLHRP